MRRAFTEETLKILLTGGTGFIGRHLARTLSREGHSLRLFVRDPAKIPAPAQTGFEMVRGDLRDPSSLARAADGVEAVVHAGGLVHAPRTRDLYEVNGEGTARLAKAAAASGGARRFLYLSSQAACGPSREDAPSREEDPPKPVSHYGWSKLRGEEAVRSLDRSVPWTILRPPAVYGPGDAALLPFYKMASRGRVSLPCSPTMRLSLVHVEDLCEGVALALGSPAAAGQVYFLTEPGRPTVGEVVDSIGKALGREASFNWLPAPALWSAAAAASLWAALTGRSGFLSLDKLREFRGPAWLCSAEKAERQLGFRAGWTLPEGIRTTAAWYRKEGWI